MGVLVLGIEDPLGLVLGVEDPTDLVLVEDQEGGSRRREEAHVNSKPTTR